MSIFNCPSSKDEIDCARSSSIDEVVALDKDNVANRGTLCQHRKKLNALRPSHVAPVLGRGPLSEDETTSRTGPLGIEVHSSPGTLVNVAEKFIASSLEYRDRSEPRPWETSHESFLLVVADIGFERRAWSDGDGDGLGDEWELLRCLNPDVDSRRPSGRCREGQSSRGALWRSGAPGFVQGTSRSDEGPLRTLRQEYNPQPHLRSRDEGSKKSAP
ncbi:hypothetical protein AXG93_1217s1450 [Marchantia polymorpha subsp. ruderalis]|uniref:Uncharacterized protein n=1 Tax=Marchantia polymorpha subsp. ruderalis TaxID=1480154 RepID=A0A176VU38_MARPO|nr:hypothetical protein AXG93_1217s1450 [Marchantia polymorpha subsp. ruderalis]